MKVEHYTKTTAEVYPGAEGISIRWVIGQDDDAPNFAMRIIDVEAGCNTPFHTHGFEHEVYVLAGEGVVKSVNEEHPIAEGNIVYVKPDEEHGFFNRGDGVLRFICVIPHQD